MTTAHASPRLAMCIEQTLGHRTHGQNLERAIASDGLSVDVFRIEYPKRRVIPMPWALRSSAAAARQLRRGEPHDVTLFHTETISLFAPLAVRGRPFVVSLDATPVQMDAMAEGYSHRQYPRALEAAKRHWYRRVFARAAGIIAWSEWTASSVVRDYGVERERVLVAHPGAPQAFFELPRPRAVDRPRILFVGGDFERKGGATLLRAFRRLGGRAELVLVTEAPLAPEPGVRVLHGIRPGTAALHEAFAEADIFCLPTLAECTGVAIGEAMAAGLPVVSTEIASNPEWVPEGTGVLVPPGDAGALRDALRSLLDDGERRARTGERAREWARAHMDAAHNANRIVDFLTAIATGERGR